ncbi:hypothetical protein FQN53_004819 [Emmonsiellopsis sp. PD_33]|nr:hypothetical protein FQN53_004819 [Emmonsiellopsis sp. PD_33]
MFSAAELMKGTRGSHLTPNRSQLNEAWEDVRKYAAILNNARLSAAADNFIEDLEQ